MKNFSKKLSLFLMSLFVGIGLFIWIGKTVGWQEIKNAFLVFTGWQGIVILGLTLLIMLIGNWKWKEILKGENIKISFKNLLNPYLAGFAIMWLAPILFLGGEVFRAYFLKKKNFVSWQKGIASVFIDRILEWTTNLFIIFLGILFFLLMAGIPPKNLVIILGGLFLFFTGGISYFYLKIFKRESIIKFLLRIFGLRNFSQNSAILDVEKEIFNFFKLKRKSMNKILTLSFLQVGIMYVKAWLLISFLGKDIGFLPVLSILGFYYLATMIPIPASLGIHEAIQTFSFNSLGLGLNTATAFTMIIRGAELIIALVGLIILFRLGVGLIKNALLKDKYFNNNAIYH